MEQSASRSQKHATTKQATLKRHSVEFTDELQTISELEGNLSHLRVYLLVLKQSDSVQTMIYFILLVQWDASALICGA